MIKTTAKKTMDIVKKIFFLDFKITLHLLNFGSDSR